MSFSHWNKNVIDMESIMVGTSKITSDLKPLFSNSIHLKNQQRTYVEEMLLEPEGLHSVKKIRTEVQTSTNL